MKNKLAIQDSKFQVWVGAVLVGIVLVILDYFQVISPVRGGLEILAMPFTRLGAEVVRVSSRPWQVARSGYKAHLRIQDLELRYSETLAQVGRLKGLEKENEHLRSLLKVSDSDQGRVVIAPVVSYGYPGIAAGQSEGVVVGQMVIVNQTLVGRISQVSEHQSRVELIANTLGEGILAKTSSGAVGIIIGNGRQVVFTEVSRDDELRVGEEVITLGQEGIAKDLLVGVISQLKTQASDPVQTAVVDQLVSFYEARLVEVK